MTVRVTSAADLETRAAAVLAGGSTHIVRSYLPPLFVTHAQGARKWTVDGRELVDYTMGHGALLLGHAHPAVTAAVQAQAARGTHFGAGHELEIEWAERIRALVPSAERVRFTSSGTEATLLALRLARAATGRAVIAKLDKHFHGWHDAVSADLGVSPEGIPAEVAALTRVLATPDLQSLEAALGDHRVAALIMEPSGAHYGRSPLPAGFVAAARAVCDRTGTLLVLDEVVTGFRVDRGGMQALLGVRPDLTTFAKALAGGLPGAAVGGRADVMGLLGAGPAGEPPRIRHPGTFNANPLAAAAGCTALRLIAEEDVIERAATAADHLVAIWRDRMRATGVAGDVWRLASIVHSRYDDPVMADRLGATMREEGVDLFHNGGFVSAAHTDADIEATATALDRALRRIAGRS